MFQGLFNIKYWFSLVLLLVISEGSLAQCVADFSFLDKGNGNVEFYDSSSTSNKYYSKWYFGDGNTSTLRSPKHSYSSPDTFTVCVVIKDSQNTCSDSICKQVILRPKCASSFNFSVDSKDAYRVMVKNTSITFGQMDYLWSFGNGKTSTKDSDSIIYDSVGNYSIRLEVNERNKACKATSSQIIQIIDTSCTANFSFINENNTYSKKFTNQSTSKDSFIYIWSFGDGDSSSSANPTHTYNKTGTFTTTLILSTGYKKCRDTISKSHWITGTCSASYSNVESQPGSIKFTNTSSHKTFATNKGNLTWHFGNGQTNDTNSNVITYSYPKTNFYRTKLVLNNDANCIDSFEKEIAVGFEDTCKAAFTFKSDKPNSPKNIQFNNLSRGFNTKSEWNFGNGSTSNQVSPFHVFDTLGKYKVTLIIIDTLKLCVDSIQKTVIIEDNPCAAAFDFTQNEYGLSINFVDKSTGDTLLYNWKFSNQGTSKAKNPTFEFQDTGNVLVQLITTEKDSSCTDTLNQGISLQAPKCHSEFSFSVINLEASFINLSKGYKLNYNWNFDDSGAKSQDTNPTYTFSKSGQYNVQLVVTDALGYCIDTMVKQLNVQQPEKCDANFTYIIDNANEKKVSFTSLSKSVDTHYWDFGDGNSSTDINPEHKYNQPGTYIVSLIVTKNECRDTLVKDVDIASCNAYFNFGRNTDDKYLVYIIDQSSGKDRAYTWDFGDGTTSNQDQPYHEYNSFGTYAICVSIKTTDCNHTFCDTFSLDSNGKFSLKKAFRLEVFRDTFPPANIEEFDSKLSIYPNPISNQVFLENLNENPLSIIGIISATGKNMDLQILQLNNGKTQINFENTPPGLYTLLIKIGDQYLTKRVVKQ